MAKWHALMEYVQFPLKILFAATLMLGVGNALINPNIAYLWEIDNEIIIMICEMLRYSGGFLIKLFPLLVFLVVLNRKFEDSAPVFIGFVSYMIISLVVLFLENSDAASYFYDNLLGIRISFDSSSIFKEAVRIPYNTGIFSLLAAYGITMYSYLKSRHYTMHGLLSFIDHDAWAMILCAFFSILCGIVFAYGWPLVIHIINYFYEFLASDLLNPMNLFLYGISERLSAVFGLQDIQRNAFWLSELGGSATDNFGVLYQGDVNTWYAYQNLHIVTANTGYLITPYYVINLFVIPGFLLGYFSLVHSGKDKRRYFPFFVLALALSILSGNPFPMEVLMLILAPMLYVCYLFTVGFLYAGCEMLGAAIGFWFKGSLNATTGTLMIANPGSFMDLLPSFRNPDLQYSLSIVIALGIVALVVFFFATRLYFSRFAIGLFQFRNVHEISERVIDALGGLENIRAVTSTPDKLTIALNQRDKVNFEQLREEGAYLILESKEGYLIRLGNLSTIIAKDIKKRLKKKQKQADA
ncbi:MAG: hypothetical protein HFE68_02135 [Erysipelotrichaceae bacterium]|nr:hypothetical protein [Erysipelotrichaceae bacterium]MCI9312144.1 hypothetical protein [Erysipelotrichaceae bacterium]